MISYERMWLTLKGYLQYLESRGVESISPVVVSHEMDTIYDLEDKDDQLENYVVQTRRLAGKGD